MASVGGERRHIPLMVVDTVGSTARSEAADADDEFEMDLALYGLVDQAVAGSGGHIVKTLGDGVFVTFGTGPDAPERAAIDAVGAGLDLLDLVLAQKPVFEELYGHSFEVRVAAHWGEVVVSPGSSMVARGDAFGLPANVVAKMEAEVAPDTFAISADLERQIRGYFELETLGPHRLPGLTQPLELYRVVRRTAARDRLDVQGRRSPLVGRARERVYVEEAWQRSKTEGETIVITGEPGIGKSRLIEAIGLHVESDVGRWLRLRCTESGRGRALAPVADLLDDIVGVRAEDSEELRRSRFADELGRPSVRADGTDDPMWTLVSGPRRDQADPSLIRATTLQSIVDLVLELASAGPVLITVDDLHWADATTLELIERWTSATASVSSLAATRGCVSARYAAWASTTSTLTTARSGSDTPCCSYPASHRPWGQQRLRGRSGRSLCHRGSSPSLEIT